MIKTTYLCTDCVQVITNPLCPSCFARHVLYWLRDKNLSDKELDAALELLNELIREAAESSAETSCIICGDKKVNLCTFCFINRAESIIEEISESQGLLNKFSEDFDTMILRI